MTHRLELVDASHVAQGLERRRPQVVADADDGTVELGWAAFASAFLLLLRLPPPSHHHLLLLLAPLFVVVVRILSTAARVQFRAHGLSCAAAFLLAGCKCQLQQLGDRTLALLSLEGTIDLV
jgi:hypothetical protein